MTTFMASPALIHDRICALYAKLTADPVTSLALHQFDREAGYGSEPSRGLLHRQLVDALCAYEDMTGREHPVGAELPELEP